jgi:cytochrome d ubiquinol oxidase subunit I
MTDRETHYEVKVPYVLGVIATHSLTGEVASINTLVLKAE